jgi:hypothetical protein
MRLAAIFAICTLSAATANAQTLSLGIKGGVPLSDVFSTAGNLTQGRLFSDTKRYTIGPSAELLLPAGLGIGLDILYKRFDQDLVPPEGGIRSSAGSSWEFPLVAKYRFPSPGIRPYVEAGANFNRLTGLLAPTDSRNRTGPVLGTGLELKAAAVRLTGGLRYTRWGARDGINSANLVDFLVGIAF